LTEHDDVIKSLLRGARAQVLHWARHLLGPVLTWSAIKLYCVCSVTLCYKTSSFKFKDAKCNFCKLTRHFDVVCRKKAWSQAQSVNGSNGQECAV